MSAAGGGRLIRVLAVDHTAGVTPFRKKFDALAAHPGVHLTLLAPERWIENYREVRAEAGEGRGYSVRVGRVGRPGYENRAFFRTGLGPALRASSPDILHLWEEPFSQKGIDLLLRAVARLEAGGGAGAGGGPGSRPSVAVIGSGPDEESFRILTGQLGLGNRVRFLPGSPTTRSRHSLPASRSWCSRRGARAAGGSSSAACWWGGWRPDAASSVRGAAGSRR